MAYWFTVNDFQPHHQASHRIPKTGWSNVGGREPPKKKEHSLEKQLGVSWNRLLLFMVVWYNNNKVLSFISRCIHLGYRSRRFVTTCLHQAMRLTGYASPYVARWSSVIGGFRSSLFRRVISLDVRCRTSLLLLGISFLECQICYPGWCCWGKS